MTTVRPKTAKPAMAGMPGGTSAIGMALMPGMESGHMDMTPTVQKSTIALVVALSFVVLIIGVSIGLSFA